MGFCNKELNMLAGGGGALNKPAVWGSTLAAGGVGLTCGLVFDRSGFSLEMDLVDLLESESLDLGLPATFEYDLVIGLSSLTGLGLGSLIVADGLCRRWKVG